MSRVKWKGPVLKRAKNEKIKKRDNVILRNIEITSNLVSIFSEVQVHTGKKLVLLKLNPEMIGHKIGEFCFTREKFTFKKSKKK